MRPLIAIACQAEESPPAEGPAAVARARELLRSLHGAEPQVHALGAGVFVLGCGTSAEERQASLWFAGGAPLDLDARGPTRPAELRVHLLAQGTAPAGVVAPFGVLSAGERAGEFRVLCDASGLQHMYLWRGAGIAAASNCCATLGALAAAGLDREALASAAWLGSFFDDETPFLGVRRLRAGEHWRVDACSAELVEPPAGSPLEPDEAPAFASFGEAVSAGRELLRETMVAYVESLPELALELSGGLDSRLLLAALPPELRRGRVALTIGEENADRRVARALVAEQGLVACELPFAGLDELELEEALALTRRAALEAGYSANPIARSVLGWVEAQQVPAVRLSGQNGEFARGFYYPGFAQAPSAGVARVRQLLRWRLGLHERMDAGLLAADFGELARRASEERVQRFFAARPERWLEATDEYYLRVRMQQWVGNLYSAQAGARPLACPFFAPAFLDWTRRTRPEWRRDSQLLCAVLEALDLELAQRKLASGSSPRDMARRGLGMRWGRAQTLGGKLLGKLAQRAGLSARAPGGTLRVLSLHRQRAGRLGEHFPRVFEDGNLIAPELAGRRLDDPALGWVGLGFLWNLELLLGGDPGQ